MQTPDEAQPAFTQLLDKGVSADVCLATWCPTMDLLALASSDGQLCLHRCGAACSSQPDVLCHCCCALQLPPALQFGSKPIHSASAATLSLKLPCYLLQMQQPLDCRLNWQRLWAVTPEPPATALCWRPDGMALAVGHQDGTVSILDAENGESLNQGKMVTGGVCCPTPTCQKAAGL